MKSIYFTSSLFLFSMLASAQIVNVSNATELQNALNAATPGQTIQLASGVYNKSGGFTINAGVNGSAQNPITVKGNKNTIISSNSTATGNGLWLKGNSYWILDGFTVYKSKKAIMLDNSHHCEIKNITVNYIGDEGIHLRTYSSYNLVENCYVDSVGIVSASSGTAEAIYVGSSVNNWGTYTGGNPDTSNYNIINANTFGDNIPSENIDVKEGTIGGTISNNIFNGKGLNGINSGDSWLDMKGSYYNIECNSGNTTLKEGLQTHILIAGGGDYNTFSNNWSEGFSNAYYGINIQTSGGAGTATHNIVCDNNTVKPGSKGLTNVSTQTCTTNNCLSTNVTQLQNNKLQLYPNPATNFIEIKSTENLGDYFIIDVFGKIVLQGSQIGNSATINTANLASGLYIYKNNAQQNIKFIIE